MPDSGSILNARNALPGCTVEAVELGPGADPFEMVIHCEGGLRVTIVADDDADGPFLRSAVDRSRCA